MLTITCDKCGVVKQDFQGFGMSNDKWFDVTPIKYPFTVKAAGFRKGHQHLCSKCHGEYKELLK